jgi:hypothetical protein
MRLLDGVREDDVVVVTRLDRLARLTRDLPDTVARGELRPLRDPASVSDEPYIAFPFRCSPDPGLL